MDTICYPWKMTNPNLIQPGNQTRGMGVMIGRCSLTASIGHQTDILQMLAVLISGTQTTVKANTQLKNTNGRNELRKTTKIYFSVIIGGYWKKIIKIWTQSARFNTKSQSPPGQARMILRKGRFSDLGIQEMFLQVNREQEQQRDPKR